MTILLIIFWFIIPLSGVCYGMQLAIIEYARNVLGWKGKCSSFSAFVKATKVNNDYWHTIIVVHLFIELKRLTDPAFKI